MKIRKDIKIGLFAVIMFFALYWGVNFLKGRDLLNKYNTFYTYYDNVSGIQNAAPIVMKGLKIGSVTELAYCPETNNVRLRMNIKSSLYIPDDSVLKVSSSSLLGGKELTLELGSSDQMLRNGAVIMSTQDAGLFELAGSELDIIKQKVGNMLTELNSTLEGLNKILDQGGDDIVGTLNNIRSMTAALDRTVSQDVKQLFDNVNEITGTLANNAGHIEQTLSNLDSATGQIAGAGLDVTLAELRSAVGELNGILCKVGEGEGSLGLLLNDRSLYDSLTTASGNLSSLLADIEANPKRYVHFSLFGGGKKNR